jgi:hypothetical protein
MMIPTRTIQREHDHLQVLTRSNRSFTKETEKKRGKEREHQHQEPNTTDSTSTEEDLEDYMDHKHDDESQHTAKAKHRKNTHAQEPDNNTDNMPMSQQTHPEHIIVQEPDTDAHIDADYELEDINMTKETNDPPPTWAEQTDIIAKEFSPERFKQYHHHDHSIPYQYSSPPTGSGPQSCFSIPLQFWVL